jgi:hypothetical protein
MQIKLGFTINSHCEQKPIIAVSVDNVLVIDSLLLANCGNVNDLDAVMQILNFNVDIDDTTPGTHIIKIQGLNLFDEYKTYGDFGIQVRYIEINEINFEYFFKQFVAYNPIQDQGYVDNYLIPQNKLHELEVINNQLMHVTRGDYANYINLKNGWIDIKFQTPLYNWIIDNDFGAVASSLILDFD